MGAPGVAMFCSNGHLTTWIEERLFWDDNLLSYEDKQKKTLCVCGAPVQITISHYGGLNDCICLESEIPTRGIVETDKEDSFLVPYSDAQDKEGKPIEAYHLVTRRVYSIPEDVISGKRWKVEEQNG